MKNMRFTLLESLLVVTGAIRLFPELRAQTTATSCVMAAKTICQAVSVALFVLLSLMQHTICRHEKVMGACVQQIYDH